MRHVTEPVPNLNRDPRRPREKNTTEAKETSSDADDDYIKPSRDSTTPTPSEEDKVRSKSIHCTNQHWRHVMVS